MHRLFVALRPSTAIRRHCLDLIDGGPPDLAWQQDDQLHLTLRFIGEVERPMAEDIAAALGSIRASAVESACTASASSTSDRHGALFARAIPRDPLDALKEGRRAPVVCRAGARAARLSPAHHPGALRRAAHRAFGFLERTPPSSAPPEPIDQFILYESRLGHDGAHYEAVAEYPLG